MNQSSSGSLNLFKSFFGLVLICLSNSKCPQIGLEYRLSSEMARTEAELEIRR